MKICAFCGKPGGSVEHIIAQWLIERMGATGFPIQVAHRKQGGVKLRPPHGLKSYTSKAVCNECNNGWMSQLEVWFQRNMGMLVEPTWPKFAREVLKEAMKEKGMLARWALKTVTMMGWNSQMGSVIDDSTAKALFAGNIADDVVVEIGELHEPTVGAIFSRGAWIENGGRPPKWQEHVGKKGFKAIIQLNHLAIRVFRFPGAHPAYEAPFGRLPLRCYPNAQDPYTGDFRFHDVFEFDEGLKIETSLRHQGVA